MSDDRIESAGTVSPEESDPKSITTALVGAVGVILLAVIIILLQVLYYRTAEAERWRKVVLQQPEELRKVQNEHLDQLNSYRWIDESQGVVAIPIERAKERILREAREAPVD